MSAEPERWSGYATQSEAWQRGYEWAYQRGEHAALDAFDAPQAYGYDFDTPNDRRFDRGATFAQLEQQEKRLDQ